MKFFQELSQHLNAYNLKMTISQNGETIAVAITPVPKQDVSKVTDDYFPPMIFSGTAQELDENIIEKLKTPLTKTEGLINNIGSYAKQLVAKEADAKAKTANNAKAKDAKAKATSSAPTLLLQTEPEEEEEETE